MKDSKYTKKKKNDYKKKDTSSYEFDILQKRFNLKNLRVLEIGVGSGRDMKKFQKAGAKLYGIDISSKFIDDLNKEFEGEFKTIDIRDISNLKIQNIDLIYSRWSLLSLQYDEFKKFLIDSQKILRPNSKIMISLRAGDSLKNIHKNSKMQSIQLNAKNVQEALPKKMEIEFLEITDCATSTNPNDKQITFIISNSIYKAPRAPYLD